MNETTCHECGNRCIEDESTGVYVHVGDDDARDYDADADHVAIPESPETSVLP